MSRLNEPSKIRIYVNITDAQKSDRKFLNEWKSKYEREITQEIDTNHFVVENSGAGTYLAKKMIERFGSKAMVYAETPIEKPDLPIKIQEAKRWQKKLKEKKLTLRD